jgi:formate hydrogenlyase transcriptional activator
VLIQGETQRYEAVLRISEALSTCQQPEELARILADQLGDPFLRSPRRSRDEHTRKQREEIVRIFTETRGRVGGADGAAARMGINCTTLVSRLKKFGINPKHYS